MVSTPWQQLLCLLCPQPAGPSQKGKKALRAPAPTRSSHCRWHQQHPLPTAQPLTNILHEGLRQPCSSEGDILARAGAAPTCCTRWPETQHVLGRGSELTQLLQGSQRPPEQARASQAPGWGTRWLQALCSARRAALLAVPPPGTVPAQPASEPGSSPVLGKGRRAGAGTAPARLSAEQLGSWKRFICTGAVRIKKEKKNHLPSRQKFAEAARTDPRLHARSPHRASNTSTAPADPIPPAAPRSLGTTERVPKAAATDGTGGPRTVPRREGRDARGMRTHLHRSSAFPSRSASSQQRSPAHSSTAASPSPSPLRTQPHARSHPGRERSPAAPRPAATSASLTHHLGLLPAPLCSFFFPFLFFLSFFFFLFLIPCLAY